jgi:hypothetical protein
VDVAPWGADFNGIVYHKPPMTFVAADYDAGDVALAPEEVELLGGGGQADELPDLEPITGLDDRTPDEDDLPPLDDEESATLTRFGWEESRRRVGRMRIPPKAA